MTRTSALTLLALVALCASEVTAQTLVYVEDDFEGSGVNPELPLSGESELVTLTGPDGNPNNTALACGNADINLTGLLGRDVTLEFWVYHEYSVPWKYVFSGGSRCPNGGYLGDTYRVDESEILHVNQDCGVADLLSWNPDLSAGWHHWKLEGNSNYRAGFKAYYDGERIFSVDLRRWLSGANLALDGVAIDEFIAIGPDTVLLPSGSWGAMKGRYGDR